MAENFSVIGRAGDDGVVVEILGAQERDQIALRRFVERSLVELSIRIRRDRAGVFPGFTLIRRNEQVGFGPAGWVSVLAATTQ